MKDKNWILSLICFIGWAVILLAAFALLIVAVTPAATISKPVLFFAALVILIATFAVKICDAILAKRHTSATGY